MPTYTKKSLTGSTNGQQIKVAATTNAGANTVHTAVAGTTSFDEIYLYAYNDDGVNHLLTLLWGGTAEPDNVIRIVVPSKGGRLLICDGMLLQNGLAIKAYADAANVVVLDGFVNNIA
jgi:hypothetical protein